MVDNGDDASETRQDTGGFVFGEERTTDDEGRAAAGGRNVGIVAAAVLLVVIIAVVVLATAIQPFGMDSGETGDTAPDIAGATTMVGATSGTGSTEAMTPGGPAAADSATPTQQTDVSTTPPSSTAMQTAQPPTAQPETPTPTQTATRTATPTATPATAETATPVVGDRTESATTTSGERSPVIETFVVTDRSDGGDATFDVAWNVSDSNRDLVAVEVSLVADPDGEARIIERRRFDAGGARTTGSTTFVVKGGAGAVYEVRIEVVDGSGNTVFQLTRAVADGSPDE